jgi:voltage-gated potassium channel
MTSTWPRERRASRRQVGAAVARICVSTTILFSAFAVAPWELRVDGTWVTRLAISIFLLAVVVTLELVAVARSPYPRLRAVEAMAACFPLLIVLFAATYFAMDQANPASFNEVLTRTDAVYFTVTVLATVGFGDIVPTTEAARIAVTIQMVVDLALIGFVARVLLGTVQRGRAALRRPQSLDADRPEHVAD